MQMSSKIPRVDSSYNLGSIHCLLKWWGQRAGMVETNFSTRNKSLKSTTAEWLHLVFYRNQWPLCHVTQSMWTHEHFHGVCRMSWNSATVACTMGCINRGCCSLQTPRIYSIPTTLRFQRTLSAESILSQFSANLGLQVVSRYSLDDRVCSERD